MLWLDTPLHQVSSMFDDQEDARMSTDFRLESFKKLECVWFLNGGLRRAAALQGLSSCRLQPTPHLPPVLTGGQRGMDLL